jgi:spermidine/putrescine transport system substrate-binding protein
VKPTSNRHQLFNLLLIVALLAAACQSASTPTAAGPDATPQPATEVPQASPGSLTVFDWSGYELPEFWEPFAAEHPDIEPDFSFFAEDAEAYAKLQTGFAADTVHPCSSWWKLYVDAGLVQPIDTSRLSNWSGIRPELAAVGEFDGQQYFVPWEWGYESILVRTDKVQTMPTSWADLWNPEYAGHVALWDSGESSYSMAALALGIDPWEATPFQRDQVKQKLIDLKPNLITYWVDFTEVPLLISSGDAWIVANAWSDAFITLRDEGVPVDYIEPSEGRLGWVCGYGISSKSANVDLAYDYIDALIAPQSMANLSNTYAYGAANADALPLTDESYVRSLQLDDADIFGRTVFFKSLTEEQQQAFTSLWDEVKAAP